MKFQDDILNMNTYIHTDKPKPICPHFFKVGGINKKKTYQKSLWPPPIGAWGNARCLCEELHTNLTNEPRCEKTGLRGFRPGPTQTRL